MTTTEQQDALARMVEETSVAEVLETLYDVVMKNYVLHNQCANYMDDARGIKLALRYLEESEPEVN